MFKEYRKLGVAEMRPVTRRDIDNFEESSETMLTLLSGELFEISISEVDLFNGSPKIGDMIARDPRDHRDQWLVSEKYFDSNFTLKE